MRYSAATVGLPVMGYVAENRVIQAALGQTLRSRSSVVDYISPVISSLLSLHTCGQLASSRALSTMWHVTAHHLPGFLTPNWCLQASLQTLTLPAYAPDLRSGAGLLFVLTAMHQWSPLHERMLWLTGVCATAQPPLLSPPQACLAGAQSNELAEIGLDSGQTIRARLVVGADGSRSRVRELAGATHPLMAACQC